ncbi:SGNH/GDSL hydrolase family protein [uncultured Methylibium sp.]|uniref:SGNH/GDSL hydrolase family protein n=1 Tax=uncultured Methylibium sp. TaxID=381093 RepID=UPI0025DF5DE2|nr:SGNH/GDSL hydrolase family protein [uncultured Methylibium sp.]
MAYAISDHPFYGGEPGFGRLQSLIAAVGVALAVAAALPLRFAERVLLVAVTCLVMLALAEAAAAIVLGQSIRPIYQTDERLIFKFIPDRQSVMKRLPANGGTVVGHRINTDGFRGEELLPAGSARRVVIYGDSFIHASYTPDDETFAVVLGRQLQAAAGARIEVVNAGVSSYGPDQIILKMEDELPRLRPDLVVVSVFAGNDYGDLMRNKLFRLGADGRLVANRWTLDPAVRSKLELSQRESLLLRALRQMLGSFRSRGGADGAANEAAKFSDWDFLLAEAEREYRSFIVDGNDVVTNTHVDYYSADVSLQPESPSARYKVALMRAVLQRIRDVARAQGVPLAFLFIPHPNDVTDKYDWGPVDRARFPSYDGRNQTAPLEDAARSLGVPFVNLYEPYRAVDASQLYFRGGDDHWNAAGQRMAAELMARLTAPMLPPGLPAAASAPAR